MKTRIYKPHMNVEWGYDMWRSTRQYFWISLGIAAALSVGSPSIPLWFIAVPLILLIWDGVLKRRVLCVFEDGSGKYVRGLGEARREWIDIKDGSGDRHGGDLAIVFDFGSPMKVPKVFWDVFHGIDSNQNCLMYVEVRKQWGWFPWKHWEVVSPVRLQLTILNEISSTVWLKCPENPGYDKMSNRTDPVELKSFWKGGRIRKLRKEQLK